MCLVVIVTFFVTFVSTLTKNATKYDVLGFSGDLGFSPQTRRRFLLFSILKFHFPAKAIVQRQDARSARIFCNFLLHRGMILHFA